MIERDQERVAEPVARPSDRCAATERRRDGLRHGFGVSSREVYLVVLKIRITTIPGQTRPPPRSIEGPTPNRRGQATKADQHAHRGRLPGCLPDAAHDRGVKLYRPFGGSPWKNQAEVCCEAKDVTRAASHRRRQSKTSAPIFNGLMSMASSPPAVPVLGVCRASPYQGRCAGTRRQPDPSTGIAG